MKTDRNTTSFRYGKEKIIALCLDNNLFSYPLLLFKIVPLSGKVILLLLLLLLGGPTLGKSFKAVEGVEPPVSDGLLLPGPSGQLPAAAAAVLTAGLCYAGIVVGGDGARVGCAGLLEKIPRGKVRLSVGSPQAQKGNQLEKKKIAKLKFGF